MTNYTCIDQELDDAWDIDESPSFSEDLRKVIHTKFPGWTFMHISSISGVRMSEIRAWLSDPIQDLGPYELIGWSSGCSTNHGIVFSNKADAMLFKLSWS